jgi:MFS family permease
MKIKSVLFNMSVIVVALGYFVDIFDLTLFNMLRSASLKDLGIPDHLQVEYGIQLINSQMAGMLLGGIFWGMLGDKKGRLSTLFASIILYSVANLANAFVTSINPYLFWRFLAGLGLAGELGVGITLIAEILPKESRGLGTAVVASIGVLGACVSGIIVEFLPWRTCYIIGGSLGLCLLLLRVSVHESGSFKKMDSDVKVSKGNFLLFFQSSKRFFTFVNCILIGTPIWFVAGILMAFSPEIAVALGVTDPILASRSIAISYLGLAFGDFFSGYLSQIWQSRKKVINLFMICCLGFIALLYLTTGGRGEVYFYTLVFLIGLSAGFWAMFVMVGAEQFGTNIRATAATTIPNFVRGALIPMTFAFKALKTNYGLIQSSLIVGVVVFILAFIGNYFIAETFAKDLDFYEH